MTDDQLIEATRPPGMDEPCPDDVRAELIPILRRVEAAVRADVAAEVRARGGEWQSGAAALAENGALPIIIAKAEFAADALNDTADAIEKAGAP